MLTTDLPPTSSTILWYPFFCVTCDTWFMSHGTWHMRYDMFCEANIVQKFQLPCSNGVRVMLFWRLGGKGWLTEWMNHEGDCRITTVFLEQTLALPGSSKKPAAHTVGADPSWCISNKSQNPPNFDIFGNLELFFVLKSPYQTICAWRRHKAVETITKTG